MKGSEHGKRGYSRTGEFRGDVVRDTRKTQHANIEHVPRVAHGFEVLAAEMPQAEVNAFARDGLADDIGVALDLIADGGSNEVGAIGEEAFLDQKVDMTEIDKAKVDRDFFSFARLRACVGHWADHPIGWYVDD